MHDTVVIDATCREVAATTIAGLDPALTAMITGPTTCTDLVPYAGSGQEVALINPVLRATVAALKAAIARTKPHIPKGGSLRMLQYVRLTSGPGEAIIVTATDLDTATRFSMEGVGLPGFDALLLHEDLKGFLDGFSAKEGAIVVRLEQQADGARVRLETDHGVAELVVAPVDEFPRLAHFAEYDEADRPMGWPVDVAAMNEVAAAASSDTNRPIITGVLIEGDVVVATDSYRLFFVEGVPGWPGAPMIVPAGAVRLAHKQGCGGVFLTEDERTLIFLCPDGGLIATRLIEGSFPNWRGLVPSNYPTVLRVEDHGCIAASIKRLKWLLKDALPIRLGMRDDELCFQAVRQDRGEQFAKVGPGLVAAEMHPGAGGEGWYPIGAFNHGYLVACFADLDSDDVTFEGIDMLKPWIIRAPRANGTTANRLLMPVRV